MLLVNINKMMLENSALRKRARDVNLSDKNSLKPRVAGEIDGYSGKTIRTGDHPMVAELKAAGMLFHEASEEGNMRLKMEALKLWSKASEKISDFLQKTDATITRLQLQMAALTAKGVGKAMEEAQVALVEDAKLESEILGLLELGCQPTDPGQDDQGAEVGAEGVPGAEED